MTGRGIQLDAESLAAMGEHERRWHDEQGRDATALMCWHYMHREVVETHTRDDGTLVETMEGGAIRCTGVRS